MQDMQTRALRLIVEETDNLRLADIAEAMDLGDAVVDALEAGYHPTHRQASAYRGALVAS